jgi:hypothetical protein
MPSYDFYAIGEDHREILSFILESGECDVFEHGSETGKKSVCFRSLGDFEKRYGIADWSHIPESLLLQLHVLDAGGLVQQRKIELIKSERFPDGGFRYATNGWGLIQLYLEAPVRDSLRASHTVHNRPERLAKWGNLDHDKFGDPAAWDWEKVISFAKRLNQFIRRQGVAKKGARAILPAAAAARERGCEF